jgi:hypothetical protein
MYSHWLGGLLSLMIYHNKYLVTSEAKMEALGIRIVSGKLHPLLCTQYIGTTIACSLDDHHYVQYYIHPLTIDLYIAQKALNLP